MMTQKLLMLFFGGILILAGIMFFYGRGWQADPPPPLLSEVPEFTLTERSDRPFGLDDLRGNIWIADFIFTTCAGPCPIMSQRMSRLQSDFANAAKVKLVSFSVDPEQDTPEVLRAYADTYQAQPDKWYFLTGERGTIYDLAISGMKISVQGATVTSPIIHSTYFVLIDANARIRGYFNSNEPEALEKLKTDVNMLQREM